MIYICFMVFASNLNKPKLRNLRNFCFYFSGMACTDLHLIHLLIVLCNSKHCVMTSAKLG
jgi:hypothetical protein